MEIGKKSNLESGYVFAPYIPMNTSSVIIDYSSKRIKRMNKIKKILNLDIEIKDYYQPKSSIMSRYSKKIINNNFYGAVEIKNPL